MQKQKSFSSNKDVHWCWKITTKWWFFPVFYLFLALLGAVIWKLKGGEKEFLNYFIVLLIFMPAGLALFLGPILEKVSLGMFQSGEVLISLPYFFHPLAFISYIVILYYKYKKHRIIKWLVLALLILLVLSFIGCAVGGPPPKLGPY